MTPPNSRFPSPKINTLMLNEINGELINRRVESSDITYRNSNSTRNNSNGKRSMNFDAMKRNINEKILKQIMTRNSSSDNKSNIDDRSNVQQAKHMISKFKTLTEQFLNSSRFLNFSKSLEKGNSSKEIPKIFNNMISKKRMDYNTFLIKESKFFEEIYNCQDLLRKKKKEIERLRAKISECHQEYTEITNEHGIILFSIDNPDYVLSKEKRAGRRRNYYNVLMKSKEDRVKLEKKKQYFEEKMRELRDEIFNCKADIEEKFSSITGIKESKRKLYESLKDLYLNSYESLEIQESKYIWLCKKLKGIGIQDIAQYLPKRMDEEGITYILQASSSTHSLKELEENELKRLISKHQHKTRLSIKSLLVLKGELTDSLGISKGNQAFDLFVKKNNYDVDLSNPKTNFHKSQIVKDTMEKWKELKTRIALQ